MTRKLFGMILCAVLSVVAFGQNATTSVRGTVTDPTGAFLQGAHCDSYQHDHAGEPGTEGRKKRRI
jgi:hypothetical protein